MTPATYLTIVLVGQLALIMLDIGERRHSRKRSPGVPALQATTIAFLGAVIVVYALVQVAGLSLAPDIAELLAMTQTAVAGLLRSGSAATAPSWPGIVLVSIFAFYLAGLCDYLFHRFVSHNRWLWFTHEYHHLPTEVTAYMPGICARPFAVLAVIPASAAALFLLQLLLGVFHLNGWNMMPTLYVIVIVQNSVLGLTHSAFMRRLPWLHRLLRPLGITTPQEHWLHHASDLTCNYANFTAVWDRVFGTYADPDTFDTREHRAGLTYDQDYLGTLTLGLLKLPQAVRERCQLGLLCFVEQNQIKPKR